jgi:hypothetical protein
MTEAGVDFVLGCLKGSLSTERCRVSVSVHFPTALKALCRLSARLGDRLHIHLGSRTPKEKSSKSSPLLHSKVIWVGGESGGATIYIGSHNWTSAALDGANMEASIRTDQHVFDSLRVGDFLAEVTGPDYHRRQGRFAGSEDAPTHHVAGGVYSGGTGRSRRGGRNG